MMDEANPLQAASTDAAISESEPILPISVSAPVAVIMPLKQGIMDEQCSSSRMDIATKANNHQDRDAAATVTVTPQSQGKGEKTSVITSRPQLVSVIRKRGVKEIEDSKNSIKQKDKEESQSKADVVKPVVSTLAGSLKSRSNNPKASLGNSSMEHKKSLLHKKGESVIKQTRRGIKRPMPKEFSMRKIRRRKRIRLDADGKLPSCLLTRMCM